jgi:hypothetical protein
MMFHQKLPKTRTSRLATDYGIFWNFSTTRTNSHVLTDVNVKELGYVAKLYDIVVISAPFISVVCRLAKVKIGLYFLYFPFLTLSRLSYLIDKSFCKLLNLLNVIFEFVLRYFFIFLHLS